jgi:hypothetical protein
MGRTRADALRLIRDHPERIGNACGFTLLTDIHGLWMRGMILGAEDETLQAHRGSYKTTCVSVALALLMILRPNDTIAFMRKTDTDVKEVMLQVQALLTHEAMQQICESIWGRRLALTRASGTILDTDLVTSVRGTAQLTGLGINGSLTGKHFDRIFTDDIVNLKDRISRAEREHTKSIYMELQNLRNRGGRIFNTGTPWHVEDCFSIMPEAKTYDCFQTGLMTDEEIRHVKERMTPSLFAANYELRHIPSDDVIFTEPKTGASHEKVYNGVCHVDAAYYGEDFTAFTAMAVHDGKYYVYGKLWRKHVDDCMPLIMADYQRLMLGRLYTETNADKGYSARAFKERGASVVPYAEHENKHIKIVTYLKQVWPDVIFVNGTDEEYISQVCDYTEDAEHDDAPDSAASLARVMLSKRRNEGYKSRL